MTRCATLHARCNTNQAPWGAPDAELARQTLHDRVRLPPGSMPSSSAALGQQTLSPKKILIAPALPCRPAFWRLFYICS